MRSSIFRSAVVGSIWGITAKVLDASAKFITIPMLISFYGKADYGLIALAFSLNAYLRLMDMGMNVGSIRFFSVWLAENDLDRIAKVSRSSMVFYGVIGLANAVLFLIVGEFFGSYFKLEQEQIPVFRLIMFTLAASAILNWLSNVINQLLTAYNEIGWLNRVTVFSSVLTFITAFVAVSLKLSLTSYFILFTISTLAVVPLNIWRLRVFEIPLVSLLTPRWDGKAFKVVLKYSFAIFAIGIFQFSADNLRPLLLGKFASKGISVLTEYRIIQTVVALVIAFGSVFMQVLLPLVSKMYADKETGKIANMIYKGTKYISIFLSFIVFLLILNSEYLLTLYVGAEYAELSLWLIIWLVTVLLSMHITPVASLVLSSGRTKFLIYSSAISCVSSLPITAFLAKEFNVGASVIGFFVYILLQIGAYYFYYIPKVLELDSSRLFFRSFFPPTLAGILSLVITNYFSGLFLIVDKFNAFLFNSIFFTFAYFITSLLFVIRPPELKELSLKILPAKVV